MSIHTANSRNIAAECKGRFLYLVSRAVASVIVACRLYSPLRSLYYVSREVIRSPRRSRGYRGCELLRYRAIPGCNKHYRDAKVTHSLRGDRSRPLESRALFFLFAVRSRPAAINRRNSSAEKNKNLENRAKARGGVKLIRAIARGSVATVGSRARAKFVYAEALSISAITRIRV